MKRNRTLIFIALLFSHASIFLCAATRVAVISVAEGPLQDLLTAELSSDPQIEIVERTQIAKVISEQNIAASTLDDKGALSLGKLIKTDLFVLLEADFDNKNPIGLVVFDAQTGARFQDCALTWNKDFPCPKFAADAVRQAVQKRHKAKKAELKYVSLLSVRNVDLPQKKNRICYAIGNLLMRRLMNSPGIAVLERTHLDWINKERNLPGMEWSNKLLSSNFTIEIEFSRNIDEVQSDTKISETNLIFKYSLFLNGEKKLSQHPVSGNVSGVVEEIAAAAANLLGVSRIEASDNREAEARKFFSEYKTLEGHKEFVAAHQKIETAVAIVPGFASIDYVNSLVRYSLATLYTNPEEAIDCAERAFEIRKLTDRGAGHYCSDISEVFRQAEINRFNPQNQKVIHELHQRFIEEAIKEIENNTGVKLDSKINTIELYGKYFEYIYTRLSLPYLTENDRLHEILTLFTNLAQQSRRFIKGNLNENDDSIPSRSMELHRNLVYKPPTDLGFLEENRKCFGEIYQLMQQHPSAPLRVFGKYGLISLKYDAECYRLSISTRFCDEVNQMVMEEIARMPEGDTNDKYLCYTAFRIPSFRNTPINEVKKIRKELFNFMISRNEIHCGLIYQIFPSFDRSVGTIENLDLCLKFIEMLDSEQVTVLEGDSFHSRKQALRVFLTAKAEEINNAISNDSGKSKADWGSRFIRLTKCHGNKESEYYKVIAPCIKDNNTVYAVGLHRNSNRSATLLKINIPNRTVHALDTIEAGWGGDDIIQHQNSFIYKDLFFFATSHDGIIVFDINQISKPFKINMATGLPSNSVLSFTCMNDVLYICAGNSAQAANREMKSYIVAYNLKTKTTETIAASARKEGTSPFDGLDHPVWISSMSPDYDRSRILMTAQFPQNESPTHLAGLWAFDTISGDWRHLFPRDGISAGIHDRIQRKGGRFMFCSNVFCAMMDFDSDSHELIFSAEKNSTKFKYKKSKLNGLEQDFNPPYIVTENFLWSGNFPVTSFKRSNDTTIGRIALDGSTIQRFPQVGNTFWSHTTYFDVTQDNKHIIWCNAHDVWMIQIQSEDL